MFAKSIEANGLIDLMKPAVAKAPSMAMAASVVIPWLMAAITGTAVGTAPLVIQILLPVAMGSVPASRSTEHGLRRRGERDRRDSAERQPRRAGRHHVRHAGALTASDIGEAHSSFRCWRGESCCLSRRCFGGFELARHCGFFQRLTAPSHFQLLPSTTQSSSGEVDVDHLSVAVDKAGDDFIAEGLIQVAVDDDDVGRMLHLSQIHAAAKINPRRVPIDPIGRQFARSLHRSSRIDEDFVALPV